MQAIPTGKSTSTTGDWRKRPRPIRHRGIVRAARALAIDRSDLYRILIGEVGNPEILRRYEIFQKLQLKSQSLPKTTHT